MPQIEALLVNKSLSHNLGRDRDLTINTKGAFGERNSYEKKIL